MSRSFFTIQKDSDFAAGSNVFSMQISSTPTAFGLTAGQASNYASLNGIFQAAYLAATTPATRTVATVRSKTLARQPLQASASDLAKLIDGTSTVTDAQKINLGLSVRSTPSPRPAPGTPFKFTQSMDTVGILTLKWKCNNPAGSSGTFYQVYRKIGAAGTYQYLGGAGERKFIDSTIPPGTAQITYQIQAIRSTMFGPWAQYTLNFGFGGAVTSAEEATPAKKAA